MARKNRNHKDIRCPKCSGSPVGYKEVSTQVHEFGADETGIQKTGELMSSDILYVVAVCGSCDHEWKLRGINQVTDLQSQFFGAWFGLVFSCTAIKTLSLTKYKKCRSILQDVCLVG